MRWCRLLLVALLCTGCQMDKTFVFMPTPWQAGDWATQSGVPLEEVWFEADDGVRLFGWYIAAPQSQVTMLWCHGNAGNIAHRLQNAIELYRRGISVFIFDYRGYGQSQGRPSEAGLYRDAQAAYTYLTTIRQTPPQDIILFGRSLGASVVADIAARQPAAGVMLETPFPSIAAMAQAHYAGLPMHMLVQSRFEMLPRLAQIEMPVLVIYADGDTTVPVRLSQEVYDAVRAPKALYRIEGAGHNDTYVVGGEAYFERLLRFVSEVQ
jgi:uncharacterized protein